MVKIINGEIVQDNDPRLKQRSVPNSGNNSGTTASRIGRIGEWNESAQNNSQPHHPRMPAQNTSPPNPIETIARALGIQDNYIDIPPIPQLGFSPTRLGLIYVILVGLLFMILGWRSLLFCVVIFGLWKHSQR